MSDTNARHSSTKENRHAARLLTQDPEFDGLVAVVTYGASGIGPATARLLVARGARVAVLDIAPETLPEADTRHPPGGAV